MNAQEHIERAEGLLSVGNNNIGHGRECAALADAHINLARLKLQMPSPSEEMIPGQGGVRAISPTRAPGIEPHPVNQR